MVNKTTSRHISWHRFRVLVGSCILALSATANSAANAAVVRDDRSQLSAQTGVPLYVWQDTDINPRAILIAIHGSAQQGAVMEALANNLATAGYLVIAPDIRGSGRWPVADNATVSMYDQLLLSIGDLERILAWVRKAYPKLHIYCLGESIGVGVVLKAVASSPRQVKGLVLCSAGFQPHLHNPMNMNSNFFMGMAKLIQPVDLSEYLTRYASEDARVAQEMINDPLARNKQTGLDLLGTFNFLHLEPEFAVGAPKNVPVLMIQGEQDQIVEPKSAERLFSMLKTKRKNFVLVRNCGHVLVGTSFIKPEVLSYIDNWLTENR